MSAVCVCVFDRHQALQNKYIMPTIHPLSLIDPIRARAELIVYSYIHMSDYPQLLGGSSMPSSTTSFAEFEFQKFACRGRALASYVIEN